MCGYKLAQYCTKCKQVKPHKIALKAVECVCGLKKKLK